MTRARATSGRPLGKWPANRSVEIDLAGVQPVAKGSMNAWVIPNSKRAVVTDSNAKRLRPFEAELRAVANAALDRADLPCASEQPFFVELAIYLPRPAGDIAAGGVRALSPLPLKASARTSPWTKPDLDKLERAVLDSLTRIVWDDDARVVKVLKQKHYAGPAHGVGVWIRCTVKPATVREASDWDRALAQAHMGATL